MFRLKMVLSPDTDNLMIGKRNGMNFLAEDFQIKCILFRNEQIVQIRQTTIKSAHSANMPFTLAHSEESIILRQNEIAGERPRETLYGSSPSSSSHASPVRCS